MSYNGHKNYETWAISMYIDGNYTGEGTCRYFESLAAEAVENGQECEDTKEDMVYALAARLCTDVEAEIYGDSEQLTSGIVGELLKASLSEVDWEGLAQGALSAIVE